MSRNIPLFLVLHIYLPFDRPSSLAASARRSVCQIMYQTLCITTICRPVAVSDGMNINDFALGSSLVHTASSHSRLQVIGVSVALNSEQKKKNKHTIKHAHDDDGKWIATFIFAINLKITSVTERWLLSPVYGSFGKLSPGHFKTSGT